MININDTEISQYLRRLGELSGDVESKLYKYMRKYGQGTRIQVGRYLLEVRQTEHGANAVYLNGTHVLRANVADAIDALEALMNLINETY